MELKRCDDCPDHDTNFEAWADHTAENHPDSPFTKLLNAIFPRKDSRP